MSPRPPPQRRVFEVLENDPFFSQQPGEDLSLEQTREAAFLRYKQLLKHNFLTEEETMANPLRAMAVSECLNMYDSATGAKFFLSQRVSAAGSKLYIPQKIRRYGLINCLQRCLNIILQAAMAAGP